MKITAIITSLILTALTCCHEKPHDIKLPTPEVAKASMETSAPSLHLVAAPIPVIAVPPVPGPASVPVPAPPK